MAYSPRSPCHGKPVYDDDTSLWDYNAITSRGKHHHCLLARHRYQCNHCHRRFDDLSLSVFSGHHQPLKVWVHCLYRMSLNLFNLQISKELGLHQSDVQKMTEQLRQAAHNKKSKNHPEGG